MAPQWRRRGIASRLLALAEDRAKGANCRELRLEVRRSDARLCGLYGRRGYAAAETFTRYYSDGADALRMVKRLQGGAA